MIVNLNKIEINYIGGGFGGYFWMKVVNLAKNGKVFYDAPFNN